MTLPERSQTAGRSGIRPNKKECESKSEGADVSNPTCHTEAHPGTWTDRKEEESKGKVLVALNPACHAEVGSYLRPHRRQWPPSPERSTTAHRCSHLRLLKPNISLLIPNQSFIFRNSPTHHSKEIESEIFQVSPFNVSFLPPLWKLSNLFIN